MAYRFKSCPRPSIHLKPAWQNHQTCNFKEKAHAKAKCVWKLICSLETEFTKVSARNFSPSFPFEEAGAQPLSGPFFGSWLNR